MSLLQDALLLHASSPATAPAHRRVLHLEYWADQVRRCFDALATNGKVVQPLVDAPWGELFGALGDEFGINWMFNSAQVKKA